MSQPNNKRSKVDESSAALRNELARLDRKIDKYYHGRVFGLDTTIDGLNDQAKLPGGQEQNQALAARWPVTANRPHLDALVAARDNIYTKLNNL